MTKHPDLFAALAAPFDAHEVKVRTQAGHQLHYITARTAMNRLDAVLGPENWWDEFSAHENSVLCRLTVRLPDGSTLTKCDAGGYAGMADSGDDDKSGYSDSFKRAAVKFGVARYLYRDGVPSFASERTPAGPAPAPPPNPVPQPPPATEPRRDRDRESLPSQGRPPSQPEGPPRTGKGLYRWAKEQEQAHRVGLLKYLEQWGRLQGYPGRLVEWDNGWVALAHAEAVRHLEARERQGAGAA